MKKQPQKLRVKKPTQIPRKTGYYYVYVYGDVEPDAHGPYPSSDARDEASKGCRRENGSEEGGIYWLNITRSGRPVIGAYSGGFFEDEDAEAEPA